VRVVKNLWNIKLNCINGGCLVNVYVFVNTAYAGVDLHKSFCQAIVCTHEGEVLKEGRIPTEREDIEEFFSRPDHYEPV
jgi:hypothetical protein